MFGFYKKAFKEQQHMIEVMEKREETILAKLDEANKKLYEYMDITRKEALESYRKGLQDGTNIQTKQEPLIVAREPVKSVEEYKSNIVKSAEDAKAENEQARFMTNLFSYIGEPQKEVD